MHPGIEALQKPGRDDTEESDLVARLRGGDEDAFAELVDRWGPSMLRVARLYVRRASAAEDVVQETWLSVLRSLDRFEGRSSLRTWVFAILANCGRQRARGERRYVPSESPDAELHSVEPARFFPRTHPRWAGMWSTRVDDWEAVPDDHLLAKEGREQLRDALEELPSTQALVFVLRDVDGWSSHDVCDVLELTPANQRVLLHRARTRIRARLEGYLRESER